MNRRRTFHPRVYLGIVKDQRGLCGCGCGERLGTDPTQIEFDHRIPLWKGGDDTPDNLQALTKACHRIKTRREAAERAKGKRQAGRGGRRKLNQRQQMLADLLEKESSG